MNLLELIQKLRVIVMKLLLLMIIQAAQFYHIYSQTPVGTWSDHLQYNTASSLAISPGKIYASTGASLIIYDKEYSELKKLSRVNGLTETGISAIAWSDADKVLLIAYESTNIDLIFSNSIYNLPDIRNKSLSVEKRINRVRMAGKYAYVASSFGIVVVDPIRREIYDTWHPGPDSEYNEVFDVAFGNDNIYAATSDGLWQASASDQGLSYYGNWNRIGSIPDPYSKCNNLVFSGNTLYVNVPAPDQSGDRVYSLASATALFSFREGRINTSFDSYSAGFTITSPDAVYYFRADGTLNRIISSYGWGSPDMSQAIADGDDIWIADIGCGLVRGRNVSEFNNLTLPGPGSNFASFINCSGGKTLICAGGIDDSWGGLGREFRVSAAEDNHFDDIASNNISDAVRSCFDPDDNSHFYISSWGKGLIECRGTSITRIFDQTNSPLQSADGVSPGVNIFGLTTDRLKNLWMTVSGVTGSLRVLKPNGSWISYPLNINAPVIGDIIQAKDGVKWIILPDGNGMFIIDDNNTPDNFNDDKYRKLTIKDSDGNIFQNVFSVTSDLDGNIWVGTDHGPVTYYPASNEFEDGFTGSRIKVPRNDGSGLADYMLGTETITCMTVDGANRKWVGTKSSGAYLLSADGTKMLTNYNTDNSPVFSNHITSVAVDNLSGEVWFGTNKGSLSLREVATAGVDKFGKVYSFPNPVRETFTGNVTITGLLRDTNVKITDISGNIVYETTSLGGQASWDLTTSRGKRVVTGVYLVFCSSTDGSQTCITKILVIGR
jgi:hypothetical protein